MLQTKIFNKVTSYYYKNYLFREIVRFGCFRCCAPNSISRSFCDLRLKEEDFRAFRMGFFNKNLTLNDFNLLGKILGLHGEISKLYDSEIVIRKIKSGIIHWDEIEKFIREKTEIYWETFAMGLQGLTMNLRDINDQMDQFKFLSNLAGYDLYLENRNLRLTNNARL